MLVAGSEITNNPNQYVVNVGMTYFVAVEDRK